MCARKETHMINRSRLLLREGRKEIVTQMSGWCTCCFCFSFLLKASALALAALSFCWAAFSSFSLSASAFFILFSSTLYFSSARFCTSLVTRKVSSLSSGLANAPHTVKLANKTITARPVYCFICNYVDPGGITNLMPICIQYAQSALLNLVILNGVFVHIAAF